MANSLGEPDAQAQALASPSQPESQLSSLLYDMTQQVQMSMGNMLKMIAEIDHNSTGIMEEISKCKDSAIEKKKALEEEREKFQKAAYAVLDMLNNTC